MPVPESVLFDLDGTLIDTAPDFVFVVNKLLEEEGKAPLPDQVIRNTVSNGAKALVTLAFNINEEHRDFLNYRQRLLDLYSEHLAIKSHLFQGMDLLLDTLETSGIPWGIVTNKPEQYAEPLISALELGERCSVLICPDHVQHTKPNPEPLFKACKTLKTKPVNTIYVGDHLRDIQAGQNAMMKTIVALFGYISPDDDPLLWGADFAAIDPPELTDIIFNKV